MCGVRKRIKHEGVSSWERPRAGSELFCVKWICSIGTEHGKGGRMAVAPRISSRFRRFCNNEIAGHLEPPLYIYKAFSKCWPVIKRKTWVWLRPNVPEPIQRTHASWNGGFPGGTTEENISSTTIPTNPRYLRFVKVRSAHLIRLRSVLPAFVHVWVFYFHRTGHQRALHV